MALPSPATKVHLDQATDDPKQARTELADLVDKFNSLLTVLGNIVELDAADGIKDDGAGGIAVDLGTDSGLEIVSGKLRVKANSGLKRDASDAGLSVDIDGLTIENAVDPIADYMVFHDTTAGALRKTLINNTNLPTGSTVPYIAAAAPSGWVRAQGGTIGNGSSGGSERANADTQSLFELIWDNMADSEAPVSSGRGASAAADFAANKTITLPDMRGRSPLGTGTGSGLTARTNGDTGGEEDHQLTEAELAAHAHVEQYRTTFSGGPSITGVSNTDTGTITGSNVSTQNTGDDTAHNTMHPWLALNFIIKL